ncbi:large ribosomal RNA subunit accumulation protein YCED homolog 2, chloroplastic isoform X2 [Ricinus communis]|uniref:large ribosomal RNA subunit accumulation protein YCED homolog 2, chloroplastic isoform X2 n=1 Tax=Ricinus communis TaxID=3988 RepID=UPI0007725E46|nr:large ribosomal RNA subunit accumulation protein YCED homolog 2, chloroplastic isoform X2 [Ricinus communis]|eukprot:XP_015582064.1 large ribosomal RNA subunit accumulation protein YCED homolog 2, chloroplastic isoform X2 [Ricinus communis]
MSEAGHFLSPGRAIKSISSLYSAPFLSHTPKTVAIVSRRKDFTMVNTILVYTYSIFLLSVLAVSIAATTTQLAIHGWLSVHITKQSCSRTPRSLISISTADGKWHGKWNCDYLLSLQDLQLEDLIEDEQKDAEVSISLCIQKHASFGFSVDGRILTSFTRKCSNCSSPFCREIDTNFNVWVLPSNKDNGAIQLPEIGGDDPSVIYVKPGYEANLDSLIQDTIRLTTSVKDICSESCEKSEFTLQYIGGQNAASIDKRWSRLLELKKAAL